MNFFETLYGFPETNPATVRQNLTDEGEYITSAANGKRYRCGRLEVVSLADLRARASKETDNIPFSQIVADVGALHRDAANNGALFQAASQFNLLEMVHADVSPRAGITGYANDHTQGPVCAIACAAGTTHRNYFAPVSDQIGQCGPRQIDCLEGIAAYFDNDQKNLWEMRNGYALFNKRGLRAVDLHLSYLDANALDALRGKLKIGVQWRTEVTTAGPGQVVTQAYCSALPVGYHRFLNSPHWERICRLILEATYEATLRVAVENARLTGNPNCFLTLVGGGVFQNRLPWIMEAMGFARSRVHSEGVNAVIVSYGNRSGAVDHFIEKLK